MAHQLEQHTTDTAMLSEQRTLFKAAFDAQATELANAVGSASVAQEVRYHARYLACYAGLVLRYAVLVPES